MFFEKLLFWLTRLQLWLAAFSGLSLSIMVFVASIMRYAFGSPWNATEEVVGLLFFTSSFLCLPAAAWENKHIRMDFVDNFKSKRLVATIRYMAAICLILMLVTLVLVMLENAEFSLEIGAHSEITRLNLYPWMLIAPFSLATMAAIVVLKLLRPNAILQPLIVTTKQELI